MSRKPKPPSGTLTTAEVDVTISALGLRLAGDLSNVPASKVRAMESAHKKLWALRDAKKPRTYDSLTAKCTCGHVLAHHHQASPHECGAVNNEGNPVCDCGRFEPR